MQSPGPEGRGEPTVHADSPLASRLAWLTGLRLLVLTIFLIATSAVAGGFAPGSTSSHLAVAVIASAYGLAAIYAILLRRGRLLERVTYAQLVTDQLTWTGIVFITGGVTSGATSLYGLTVLSGAILLGVRGATTAAVTGASMYGLLSAGLAGRIIQPPAGRSMTYITQWAEMTYPLFVNSLALTIVTVLASYLAERLRTTGGRLIAATVRAEEAERLAILGRVAAGLAHEIRNPLGAIAGSIELLRTGADLSPEDRHLCEIVELETKRLNELVDDMLHLARARPLTIEPVDLSALAREITTLASRSGRGSDVTVRCNGQAHAIVHADPARMRQIVWNLVRNAIQASKPGDVVDVTVEHRDAAEIALSVTDRGLGIASESTDRIFDVFFTTRSHGAGIGLAVVKRIADDHGFRIEVECNERRGTTFQVRIPLSTPELRAADRGDVPLSETGSPLG